MVSKWKHWYLNGNIKKNVEINPRAINIFDKIIPIERVLEKLFNKKIGLDIVCYMKK